MCIHTRVRACMCMYACPHTCVHTHVCTHGCDHMFTTGQTETGVHRQQTPPTGTASSCFLDTEALSSQFREVRGHERILMSSTKVALADSLSVLRPALSIHDLHPVQAPLSSFNRALIRTLCLLEGLEEQLF